MLRMIAVRVVAVRAWAQVWPRYARMVQATGSRIKQAKEKRMNRKLAGEVAASASLTIAKEVPQNRDTASRTPSAARRGKEAVSFLCNPSTPKFDETATFYQLDIP